MLLENNILISRRNIEERLRYYKAAIYKKVKQYIKNGCEGDLDLSYTPIDKLPDELTKVGGSLNLFNTQIKSLPDELTVDRNLNLRYTPITSLPIGLKIVHGFLDLGNTPLSKKYTKDEIIQMIINKCGFVKHIFK